MNFYLPKNSFISFNESLLKMMINPFNFILKALFILVIFNFLSGVFGHIEKWCDWKHKVNFKIYDVTNWLIKQLQYTY